MLIVASILLIMCGVIHSYLGEKLILTRLFKLENLPHLYGSDNFTKGTLRFAWHITSLAWFGFAFLLSFTEKPSNSILATISIVFLLSALLSIYFTKGKHFSWLFFSIISLLTLLSISWLLDRLAYKYINIGITVGYIEFIITTNC